MAPNNSGGQVATPIQVVFQGGGAKLCLMLVVCEVLKKYEADNRIKVEKAAGSSAGAIAAVMLASKKSPETYKIAIKAIGARYLPMMKVRWWRGAWRVFNGRAYFPDLNLERLFDELFCQNDGPKRLNDLRFEVELYFTDLFLLNARYAPSDEAIPKALARSCRFPFAFVGFASKDTEVDGGLALNLAVDRLKQDESTNGRVIGISFSAAFGNSAKSNLLSFTQQLFSAAIQSEVSRSEAILGRQNVFLIDTNIGTFDFVDALGDGLGVHYDLVLLRFQTWLEGWLGSFGPIGLDPSGHTSKLLRPVLSNTQLASPIAREIDDRLKSEPCTHALGAFTYETAMLDGHGEFLGKYRTRIETVFRVIRRTNVFAV
jgi:predicted acylesterase/phospholipase RssA